MPRFLVTFASLVFLSEQSFSLELIVNSTFSDSSNCTQEISSEASFHVIKSSDPVRSPWHENLRAQANSSSRSLGKLAIGTVVRAGETSARNIGTRNYVYVFTLVESPYRHQLSRPALGHPRGFIFGRSIALPEDWAFQIEDSFIRGADTWADAKFLEDKVIRVSRDDDGYRILSCCRGSRCENYPVFSVFDKDSREHLDDFASKPDDLGFVSSWIPRPAEEFTFSSESDPSPSAQPERATHSHGLAASLRPLMRPDREPAREESEELEVPSDGEEEIGIDNMVPRERPTIVASLAPTISLVPRARPEGLARQNRDQMSFPVVRRPQRRFWTGMRRFGAARRNGRRHAGCDLYRPTGERVVAIRDGVVLRKRYFYLGTYALEVRNSDGSIYLYGEISGEHIPGVSAERTIRGGQPIAKVGDLRGIRQSMLHFEKYSGEARGALTQHGRPPYKRRRDLQNPTDMLQTVARAHNLL